MAKHVKTAKSGTNENTGGEDEENASLEMVEETVDIAMDKRIDLAVAAAVTVVGVLILIGAKDISEGSVTDPVGSRGLAHVTGAWLVIAGIALSIRQLLTWSALPGNLVPLEGQADDEGHPASWVRFLGVTLASLLSLLFLRPLGYLIVTPVLLFIIVWIMGVRSKAKLIAFPIIFTVTVWLMFGPILGVRLPMGPLTSLAQQMGILK